jgi:hypothetical protein
MARPRPMSARASSKLPSMAMSWALMIDVPAVTRGSPRPSSTGFSWGDAGIGAGAALGAVFVAAGAGIALRGRSVPAH